MRIILLLSLALSVFGQSKDETRADEKRADQWRKLLRKNDHASKELIDFQETWKRDCAAKGMEFNMRPSGDPGCILKAADKSAEAKPPVAVKPPVEKK